MMYVVVGINPAARGEKRRAFLNKTPAEELQWENMSIEELGSLASTPSLWGNMQAFVLTGALSDPERGEEFLSLAEGLVSSPHVFVFEEEKLLKKQTDAVTKAGATVAALAAPKKEESFNVFSLASTFALRDRKKFWILLVKALRAGVVPENITGILHWKVRDMLAATRVAHYTRTELIDLSRQLVVMYHDAHRGAGDLALLLERFALTL